MEILKVQLLMFVFVLVSCNSIEKRHQTDKVKSFITGTYVRAFEGEYSRGNDTLIIDHPDVNNNYYTIQHRMSYVQIKEGKPLPVAYKIENWTAIFSEQDNILEEQKRGKRLSFLPNENTLLLGGSKFKKIQ